VERLKESTLSAVCNWARRAGLVLFIDTDGALKIYPKKNPAWHQLEAMLFGRHTEMKMFLIRNTRGEDNGDPT
jgi:hypothetical protein